MHVLIVISPARILRPFLKRQKCCISHLSGSVYPSSSVLQVSEKAPFTLSSCEKHTNCSPSCTSAISALTSLLFLFFAAFFRSHNSVTSLSFPKSCSRCKLSPPYPQEKIVERVTRNKETAAGSSANPCSKDFGTEIHSFWCKEPQSDCCSSTGIDGCATGMYPARSGIPASQNAARV